VRVDGASLNYVPQAGKSGWRYEGNTLTTIVTTLRLPVAQVVTIKVARSSKLAGQRSELNGFAGAMTRLNDARYTLQHTWPFSTVPDELVDAAQAGDRLGYYPDTAGKQLAHYREVLPKAKARVEALIKVGISEQERQALEKSLGERWQTRETQAALADYPNKLQRALADVNDAMGVR
jgi:hypothetical protein